ncbi:MAG TPA: hypothetical protein VE954_15495 [Oligoflexus sp.]|uniref:hypothetical protein n=1 Tax=Oligoflexus sp. TaxID=1971216 RepID=UPI002D458274|nr:hypothetical protein [Oligoflexus sp.]HYX34508.1 hypothetical protein [Oligoflexus sp.]
MNQQPDRPEQGIADDHAQHDGDENFSDRDILSTQDMDVKTSSETHDENDEHQHRIRDLEGKPIEWLTERARGSGIPEWSQLSKGDLVRRLAESAAPSH